MSPTHTGDWSDLTAQLCAIAAEVLGVATVAPEATFFEDLGADSLTMAKFCATVRKRAELPRVSMKDIYRWPSVAAIVAGLESAPAPTPVAVPVPRVGVESAPAPAFLGAGLATEIAEPPPPPAAIESVGLVDFFATVQAYRQILSELLAGVEVSPGAHVFDDLGADSMTMAKFCATVRKRAELPKVSMKDIYRHPTLAELAAALAPGAAGLAPLVTGPGGPTPAVLAPASDAAPAPIEPAPTDKPPSSYVIDPVGWFAYAFCGLAQLAILLLLPVLISVVSVIGYRWLNPAHGLLETYLRAVTFAAGGVLACFCCRSCSSGR